MCYFFHLFFAASGKELWADEVYSINTLVVQSFGSLFVDGLGGGQTSTSPLSYVFEKFWFEISMPHVFANWDIRIFFRTPSIAFTSLAGAFIFASGSFWANRRGISLAISLLIGLCLSVFWFSNSFTRYYGLEARPYSLWYFLTTLQALIFFQDVSSDFRARKIWAPCAIALLASLTTYASLMQSYAIEFTFLVAMLFRGATSKEKLKIALKSFGILLPATLASAYYLSRFDMIPFEPGTFEVFYQSVMEVTLKTWHHHGPEPLFVTLPFILIFCPIYWWRQKSWVFWAYLPGTLLLLLTFVPFALTVWKGGLLASRYFIYLTPLLSLNYFLSAFTLFHLGKPIFQRIPPLIPKNFLLGTALAIYGISALWKITANIPEGYRTFVAEKSYQPELHRECPISWNGQLEALRAKRLACLGK